MANIMLMVNIYNHTYTYPNLITSSSQNINLNLAKIPATSWTPLSIISERFHVRQWNSEFKKTPTTQKPPKPENEGKMKVL